MTGVQTCALPICQIDYAITDRHHSPPGTEGDYVETVLRLPNDRFCYEPPAATDSVKSAPVAENGYVTFGCFNNVAKIGPRTVALWARLLKELPSSRLVLKWLGMADGGDASISAAFASHGIDRGRLTLLGWSADPYEPYRGIDLCLDPVLAGGGKIGRAHV